MKTVLNIASGKILPLGDLISQESGRFLINDDVMYFEGTEPEYIEEAYENWDRHTDETFYCKTNTFEFMERTKIQFDLITIYRFLEHVSMDKVEYFIYLLSTVTKKGSLIDIIVPDYDILAKMILKEKINKDFPSHNILLTTELLNESSDPHATIWTEKRAKYFFELEGRFKIIKFEKNFEFDGRNIYLRFLAERL